MNVYIQLSMSSSMPRSTIKAGVRPRGPTARGAKDSQKHSAESSSAPTTPLISDAAWKELQSRADFLIPIAMKKNPEVTTRLMDRYRAEIEVVACLPLGDGTSGIASSCSFAAADAYLKRHDSESYYAIRQQTLAQLAALVHHTWPERVAHYSKIFADVLDSDTIAEVVHDMAIWRIQNSVPDVFGDNWFDEEGND